MMSGGVRLVSKSGADLKNFLQAAHQKWQIANLRSVYVKISLAHIRALTRSAETGEPLASDEAVAARIADQDVVARLAVQ